jgi:sulfite exporter TauE/SafE
MTEIMTAFLTGLTAGGLSCLAIQGGLLASSMASKIEENVKRGLSGKQGLSQPLLLFLFAKLIIHTLLGFALGWIGSMLQLTPLSRAILQIGIGIFLIGNALRILNIHPVFRFFSFEPPAFIRRAIRRKSKNGDQWITPLILGGMTILIPCGITQSMMTLAIASGNPFYGAALMFAFILGTSPVFFVVAYFTSQLGARLEKGFSIFVALVLLVLGLFSIYTGKNLISFPDIGISNKPSNDLTILSNPFDKEEPIQNGTQLTINVMDYGYKPNHLQAQANQTISLRLVTQKTNSCSRAFVIPALNVQVILPATGMKYIQIPSQKPGSVLKFSCSMGMYTGDITFY